MPNANSSSGSHAKTVTVDLVEVVGEMVLDAICEFSLGVLGKKTFVVL